METWLIILICAVCVIFAFTFVWCIGVAHAVGSVFFARQNKTDGYKYFTADEFGVRSEEFAVYYNNTTLAAHIYTAKPISECDRVVIFSHGFGAGTSGYTTEICALAERGYTVVAADAYGCNDSQGKSIRGFYAGAEAVIATYIAVRGDKRFAGKKVVLVGHSWGAYSVLCAASKISVDGVVALSSFTKPSSVMTNSIKRGTGIAVRLLLPAIVVGFKIISFFKFGTNGDANAAKRIEKSGVKALLIHGERDKVVPYSLSAAKVATGANIEKLICADKYHNPYNTVAGESKLNELLSAEFTNKEEESLFLKSFDWNAATEEDEAVMQKIFNFIESV